MATKNRWIASADVRESSLHSKLPVERHIYGAPFSIVYLAWFYVYLYRYDDLLGSSEFTLFTFMIVAAAHALSFLVCQWSVHAKAMLTCKTVCHSYSLH
jgi:cation-transporting ATPase 13A1